MKRERRRRMKPYYPRRRRSEKNSGIQELKDLEHKISADIGDYIVLIDEGSKEQVETAKQKARSDFLKFAPEMQKLGEKMGPAIAKDVEAYLKSIDALLHLSTNWVDAATLSQCFQATRKLEQDFVL